METEWFSNRFHLDRDDKGPESEEEVWEGDDSDETPDKQPVVRVRREKHLGPLVSVKSNWNLSILFGRRWRRQKRPSPPKSHRPPMYVELN